MQTHVVTIWSPRHASDLILKSLRPILVLIRQSRLCTILLDGRSELRIQHLCCGRKHIRKNDTRNQMRKRTISTGVPMLKSTTANTRTHMRAFDAKPGMYLSIQQFRLATSDVGYCVLLPAEMRTQTGRHDLSEW